MPPPSPEIETSYYFPGYTEQKFPIGEVVTALCHFSNDGESPFNVTAIMGSLNNPFDFSFYIQNYSYKPVGIMVRPGEEISFEYQFQLHPNLEPVEYALSHTVFYENDKIGFSSTFFNQTVELYYSSSDYDFDSILKILGSIGFTCFVVYITVTVCTLDKKPMKSFARSKHVVKI